jgi:hypothetical protein
VRRRAGPAPSEPLMLVETQATTDSQGSDASTAP